ncbi:Hypothetical protein CAP_1531 [Chondromyces apiculatus DSM 436]|uniref:Phospholipase D-like domain-containing protein n=1 Tax=Chondromyces apiculatus DSM 436 TaxID=1192034 RepID=A0A017TC57_9BACT|nr:Hypothetical protein CAP_1531 [Chondromyces apiculatus DSM 436]
MLPSPLGGLEDDYRHAVLHLAWDLNTKSKERTLLFSFVELLPAEIPSPIDDFEPLAGHRLGNDSQHRVYVRHAVTTARQALGWYLDARAGTAVLPDDDGTLPATDNLRAKRLKIATLGEEPAWPVLVSNSDDSDILPFIPQWIHCPRTHHLLPIAAFALEQLWSAQEAEKAWHWLEGRLHFDLGNYPEYWGSAHLIAPNPLYRKLKSRLQRRQPPAESVLLRFQPRAGKSIEGLELIFHEKEPWGVTTSRRLSLRSPLVRMNLDREVNSVTRDVWDPRRGFLETTNHIHVFIKAIDSDIEVTRRVMVRGEGQSYEVMRSRVVGRVAVGSTTKIAAVRSRLLDAHYARQKQRTAKTHDQRWFRNQKEEARALLRSLFSEARSHVLVVDPYFGAKELVEFTLAVGRYDVPIHILSSAELLKKPAFHGCTLEKGDQLLNTLGQTCKQERMNAFEIRVMTGDRPTIHDRFIAFDRRIWLLGSSLNEFGSRGTMMLALPDPDAVRGDLLRAWEEAASLEAWVERRQQNREKTTGEEA